MHCYARNPPHVPLTSISSFIYCLRKAGITATEDKDFGELVFRLQLPHFGILLTRIEEANLKLSLVTVAIKENYGKIINKFSVINSNKLRIKE